MRSLNKRITVLITLSMVLLFLSIILIYYVYNNKNYATAKEAAAKNNLLIAEELIELKYPGAWRIQRGDLFKGEVVISNNFQIVDFIERATKSICVVFNNNSCAATSVFDKGGCNRALDVDTYALREGTIKTLDVDRCYLERSEIMGKVYQTAYKPVTNQDGQIIGLLFIGVPLDDNLIFEPLKVMGFTGFSLTLIMVIIANYYFNKSFIKPLREVISSMQQAANNKAVQPLSVYGSSEIKELSQAFNQLLGTNTVRAPYKDIGLSEGRHSTVDISEEEADKWVETMLGCSFDEDNLPKGLSSITFKQIILYFKQNAGSDITVENASKALSLSKVTVRRYFNFLEEYDLVEIEQRYGSVGRPLKVYTLREE